MTASTYPITARVAGAARLGSLAGTRPLLRKELGEWRHGRRAAVVLIVTTLFMVLTAANSAITALIIASLPSDANVQGPASMAPLDNLMAAASSQIFVVAAILAAMSLLVVERESGTLAWIASKPVSRGGIWLAKWLGGSAALGVAAGIVPVAVTVLAVTGLYGLPPVAAVAAMTIGIVAAVALYVAIALATSTVTSNQGAVAAITLAAFVLPTILGSLLPFDIRPFLPTSILEWAVATSIGMDVGVITPLVYAGSMVMIGLFSVRRMERIEL